MMAHDSGPVGTPEKDPGDWTIGDEPIAGPQGSYLRTLAHQAGREVPEGLVTSTQATVNPELESA